MPVKYSKIHLLYKCRFNFIWDLYSIQVKCEMSWFCWKAFQFWSHIILFKICLFMMHKIYSNTRGCSWKVNFFVQKMKWNQEEEERVEHFYSVCKQTHKKVQHNFWKICVNKCYFLSSKISLKFFVCQVAHMIFSAETDRQLVEHAYNQRNFIFMLIAFGIYTSGSNQLFGHTKWNKI